MTVAHHEIQLMRWRAGNGDPVVVVRLAGHSIDDDMKPYAVLTLSQAEAVGVALIRGSVEEEE